MPDNDGGGAKANDKDPKAGGPKANDKDPKAADNEDEYVEPGAKRAKMFKDFGNNHAVSDAQVRERASVGELQSIQLQASTDRAEKEGQLRKILNQVGPDHKTLAHTNLKDVGYDKAESLLFEGMLDMLPEIAAALPEGEREQLMGPLRGVVGRLLVILEKREGDHKDSKSFLELAFFSRDAAFIEMSQAARLKMACGLMENRKAVNWTGGSSLSSEELKEAKATGLKAGKAAAESQKAKKTKGPSSSANSSRPRGGSGGGGGYAKTAAGPPGSCNKCGQMG
jgi:hypothetical protein